MKKLCKICPQLALCLIRPGSLALDPVSFYPQRVEINSEKEIVFRCFTPRSTGENADAGYTGRFVVRVKKH